MLEGVDFLVVLKAPYTIKDGRQVYPMARSVVSSRELPVEAQRGVLDAVIVFIEIQDQKNDRVTWDRMGSMLDAANPLMLVTALEQLFKFRRGIPKHLFSLRPLFDHPVDAIRKEPPRSRGRSSNATRQGSFPRKRP